jgi:hypothetical protein
MPVVVCILGMHRSGTSFITRALRSLGVYLGPDTHTIGPREDNPQGFSEHQHLTHLNDEMLIALGGNWHTPPPLPTGWETDPGLDEFAARARRVLDLDFASSPLWGWKDPRTCLTLPFWQRLLPSMRYVICIRSPLAVAQSLQARDGFPIEKGASLWVDHTAAALSHTSGRPRLLVAYDDAIDQPEVELERLAAFIGRPRPADSAAAVRAFADLSLRHHHQPLTIVLDDPVLPFAAKALYLSTRQLLDAQHRASTASSEGSVDYGVAVEHLAAHARLARADAQERQRLNAQLQAHGAEVAARQGELDDVQRRLAYRETTGGAIKAALRAALPTPVYIRLRRAYERVRPR